jgi:hypothetical protein
MILSPSIKRYLTALLVAGAAAFSLAATDARANGGSNSINACIGIVGGCAPYGTGYILATPKMATRATATPHGAHRTDEGVYHSGY